MSNKQSKNQLAKLVNDLQEKGWLKTPLIIEAFQKIKREDFVPEAEKDLAYLDTALPLDYGQTISQPLVVAFMLELLQPQPGEKILDIGAGSGWTTALLAYCVSQNPQKQGKVIALEIIPELKEWGENNVKKYNFVKKGIVQFILGDGKLGYEKEAPYNKILVSASASDIPQSWLQQLSSPGKIVAPIGESIVLLQKTNPQKFIRKEYPGFVFVPLR